MIEIRRATAGDIAALLPLTHDYWAFERLSGFDAERIGRALDALLADPKHGAIWIATALGEPIGYLIAVYAFSLEHGGLTAEIDEFFVTREARGVGTGSALLHAAEAEFARARCTSVSLQLGRHNDDARAFYRGRGYAERPDFELLEKALPGHAPAPLDDV